MTMQADTQAITVPATTEEAFAFLADPANLPRWAVGFARDIRRQGDGWVVATAQGDVPLRCVADAARGTIDFHLTVAPGVEVVAASRLVPNDDGAEYIFTQFQAPGMSDEKFAKQRTALAEELALLPILFRARATCPVGR